MYLIINVHYIRDSLPLIQYPNLGLLSSQSCDIYLADVAIIFQDSVPGSPEVFYLLQCLS